MQNKAVLLRKSMLIVTVVLVLLLPQTTAIKATAQAKPFRVYLAFDDGPYMGRTDRILAILKAYNVKATFFVMGHSITLAPQLVKRIYLEGHRLGQHLWSHDDVIMALNNPDPQKLQEAYATTEELIHKALGEELWQKYNAEVPIKPFRWPGGAIKPFPRGDVITYNWNATTGDSVPGGTTMQNAIHSVLYGYPNKGIYGIYAWGDGSVVLMHDTKMAAVWALPAIIRDLKAHGATFEVLPRPGDQAGTMPISLNDRPPCAHRPDNCSIENGG